MKRKALAFEIALAGVSTALALICTVLYYYVPLAKISFLAMAGVALMLPLTVDKPRSAALAYMAAGGLSIAVMGPIAALPFILLFGWQPVVMGLCTRYLGRRIYISIPLKAVLFNAGLYGTYTLYGLGDTINNALLRIGWQPAYWIVALVGTALWIGYDYLMQWVYRWLERRLDKVTAKYKPAKASTEKPADEPPAPADIFGEYEDEATDRDEKDKP